MIGIRLFGTTTVVLSDGSTLGAGELGGVKSRQVLEVLALSPGVPVAKDQLAELLWDGRPPRTYLATLESYVCVLRRALRLPAGRGGLLATTSRGYVLDPERVHVDVVEMRRLLAAAASGGTGSAAMVEAAVVLAAEPLLASDAGAEWVVRERDAVTRALVDGCTRGAAAAFEAGDDDASARLAARALQLDPLAEDAASMGMRALRRAGRRAEALRVYSALREVLVDELGLDPAPETQEVYLQLLREGPTAGGRDARVDARNEVRALLGLLRQVLESVPGLDVPDTDRGLAEAAHLLVRAA